MPRWRPLPETLDLSVRQLVVQMRQLKDHSGLSLTALASRTSYSRSSWERCLNGRSLPPLWAVEALADACGGDRTTLAALWEVATTSVATDKSRAVRTDAGAGGGSAAEQPEEAATEPSYEPAAATPLPQAQTQTRRPAPVATVRRLPFGTNTLRTSAFGTATFGTAVMVSAAAVVVVLVTAGVLAAARPWESSAPRRATAAASTVPTSTYSPRTFPCYFTVRDGLLYAGHSTTLTDPYFAGVTVEAVAEIQCLVQKHGFDPKGIDASFGPNTKAAVQGFQRSRGLDDDGVVGPRTWRELRRPPRD
ncbi:helix-turn-helix domain-containing protein [Streptomyces sp. NPDC001595]|uniref:helix-turn-helix domain-containing protein n=1 Tax=Streptomyces sp. NPDC001532 TaxID=3154520 RepID=UPI0033324C8A